MRDQPASCGNGMWLRLSSVRKRASGISLASIRPCSIGWIASSNACTTSVGVVTDGNSARMSKRSTIRRSRAALSVAVGQQMQQIKHLRLYVNGFAVAHKPVRVRIQPAGRETINHAPLNDPPAPSHKRFSKDGGAAGEITRQSKDRLQPPRR